MDIFTRVLSGRSSRIKERTKEAEHVNQAFKENLDNLKRLLEAEESNGVLALLDMIYETSFPEEQVFMKAPSRARLKSKKELIVRLLIGLDSLGVPVMADLLVFIKKHGLEGVADSLLTLLESMAPLLEGKEAPEFSTDDVVDAMDFEWHSTSRTGSPLLNVIASATSSPRVSVTSIGESPLHPVISASPYHRAFSDRSMLVSRADELGAKPVRDRTSMKSTRTPPERSLTMSASSQYPSAIQDFRPGELSIHKTPASPEITQLPVIEKPASYSLDMLPESGSQKRHRRKSSSLRQLFEEDMVEELSGAGSMGASLKHNSSSSSWQQNLSQNSSPINPGLDEGNSREEVTIAPDKTFQTHVNQPNQKGSRCISPPPPDEEMVLWRGDPRGFSVDLVFSDKTAAQTSVDIAEHGTPLILQDLEAEACPSAADNDALKAHDHEHQFQSHARDEDVAKDDLSYDHEKDAGHSHSSSHNYDQDAEHAHSLDIPEKDAGHAHIHGQSSSDNHVRDVHSLHNPYKEAGHEGHTQEEEDSLPAHDHDQDPEHAHSLDTPGEDAGPLHTHALSSSNNHVKDVHLSDEEARHGHAQADQDAVHAHDHEKDARHSFSLSSFAEDAMYTCVADLQQDGCEIASNKITPKDSSFEGHGRHGDSSADDYDHDTEHAHLLDTHKEKVGPAHNHVQSSSDNHMEDVHSSQRYYEEARHGHTQEDEDGAHAHAHDHDQGPEHAHTLDTHEEDAGPLHTYILPSSDNHVKDVQWSDEDGGRHVHTQEEDAIHVNDQYATYSYLLNTFSEDTVYAHMVGLEQDGCEIAFNKTTPRDRSREGYASRHTHSSSHDYDQDKENSHSLDHTLEENVGPAHNHMQSSSDNHMADVHSSHNPDEEVRHGHTQAEEIATHTHDDEQDPEHAHSLDAHEEDAGPAHVHVLPSSDNHVKIFHLSDEEVASHGHNQVEDIAVHAHGHENDVRHSSSSNTFAEDMPLSVTHNVHGRSDDEDSGDLLSKFSDDAAAFSHVDDIAPATVSVILSNNQYPSHDFETEEQLQKPPSLDALGVKTTALIDCADHSNHTLQAPLFLESSSTLDEACLEGHLQSEDDQSMKQEAMVMKDESSMEICEAHLDENLQNKKQEAQIPEMMREDETMENGQPHVDDVSRPCASATHLKVIDDQFGKLLSDLDAAEEDRLLPKCGKSPLINDIEGDQMGMHDDKMVEKTKEEDSTRARTLDSTPSVHVYSVESHVSEGQIGMKHNDKNTEGKTQLEDSATVFDKEKTQSHDEKIITVDTNSLSKGNSGKMVLLGGRRHIPALAECDDANHMQVLCQGYQENPNFEDVEARSEQGMLQSHEGGIVDDTPVVPVDPVEIHAVASIKEYTKEASMANSKLDQDRQYGLECPTMVDEAIQEGELRKPCLEASEVVDVSNSHPLHDNDHIHHQTAGQISDARSAAHFTQPEDIDHLMVQSTELGSAAQYADTDRLVGQFITCSGLHNAPITQVANAYERQPDLQQDDHIQQPGAHFPEAYLGSFAAVNDANAHMHADLMASCQNNEHLDADHLSHEYAAAAECVHQHGHPTLASHVESKPQSDHEALNQPVGRTCSTVTRSKSKGSYMGKFTRVYLPCCTKPLTNP